MLMQCVYVCVCFLFYPKLLYLSKFFQVCAGVCNSVGLFCRKRSSKWDRKPDGDEKGESSHTDDPKLAMREKRSAKSKWDKFPNDSKWDKAPSDSKWDVRPEDVADQDCSSVGDSQPPTSVAGGCGMAAAAEAAARVNAMLMAKGTLKPAEPLLVNDSVLKSKQAVSCYVRL